MIAEIQYVARALMKVFSSSPLLLLALVLSGAPAQAEKADRTKPMNIESDALRYDDQKQTSVFSGRVLLTKGSILIRGEKLAVRQDGDGFQFGQISAAPGQLATFRQKREGLDEFIEGESESIEYDGRADVVKFIKNARMRRYLGTTLNDEFTGAVIVYNNATETFSIDGAPANGPAGTGSGRVRAMLTPKSAAPTTPASAAAAPAAPTLRSSTTLGGAAK